jgi:DeoR/GlpR family transcriptional regulator of sugar metabolism
MEKRDSSLRRRNILELLKERKELSVEFLAKQFSTSEVTIRKDLSELENTGLVVRRHGGAILIPGEQVSEATHKALSESKRAIAKKAASLIRDHNRIIIDSGSTTSGIVRYLESKQGLVVMTNSLNIANDLRELENEPTLLMPGGTWDKRSESFQGHLAERILNEYDFDQLFIGADGLDLSRGTTTYNELVGLSRAMAGAAREVVVLLESVKVERKIPNLELDWSTIDVLISDKSLPESVKHAIEDQGPAVVLAN